MLPRQYWALVAVSAVSVYASHGTHRPSTVLDFPIITQDTYNVIEVDIGTPAKRYRLLFDTGSASAWVVDNVCSVQCPNSAAYQRVGYNVNGSSTGAIIGPNAVIDYLGGTTEGPVASDIFRWGQASWKQPFLDVNETSWQWIPADGFFGLAFNSIREGDANTTLHQLMPQLKEPKFGLQYGLNESTGTGVLTIGDSREQGFIDGELVTVPVVTQDGQYMLWRTDIQGVSTRSRNGTKKEVLFDYGTTAVFDTGAGRIQLPTAQIQDIYSSLGWNYTAILSHDTYLRCSEFNSSWSVDFELGSSAGDGVRTVTFTGDDLREEGFPAAPDACWPPFDAGDFPLIGQDFLRHFYTVFDFGSREESTFKPTISFGKLKKQ